MFGNFQTIWVYNYIIQFVSNTNMSGKIKHQNVLGQKMKSFTFIKKLGEGAWAVVYEAFDQRTNTTVAIKAIPQSLMKQTPKLRELVQTEIRVLRECHNENVIRFVDSFCTQRTQFIGMEYCNGGDLEKYLEGKKRLTEDEATTFLKQILNGFRGLHQVNAMHRDFKVANVLLHEGSCKIADLGFAKQLDKQKKVTGTILGTSLTMAPELLRDQKYGMQADIWSVGVVFYQMLYGKYPYFGMSDMEILKKIQTSRPDFKGVNLSNDSRDFIEKCLTDDRTKRITWREIYNHPLIKQEEKMIYGLTSRLNVKKNEEFYQKNIDVETDIFNVKRKESIEDNVIEAVGMANVQKMQKEADEQKKISAAIQQYQKKYVNKRNNIMFIFKFVTPYIYSIYKIHANHEITLFILCKKAYHQMKVFYHFVKTKSNFLKLAPYFTEFTKSQKYSALIETLSSDIDTIMAQMTVYQLDIASCSKDIKNEFDFETIHSKNWDNLVSETINTYQYQLAEGLETLGGPEKRDLLKIIKALIFYKENKENAEIESFTRQIESMDYELEEVMIRSKLKVAYS